MRQVNLRIVTESGDTASDLTQIKMAVREVKSYKWYVM